MPTLRSMTVRLAAARPDLRPHLLPLLSGREAGSGLQHLVYNEDIRKVLPHMDLLDPRVRAVGLIRAHVRRGGLDAEELLYLGTDALVKLRDELQAKLPKRVWKSLSRNLTGIW